MQNIVFNGDVISTIILIAIPSDGAAIFKARKGLKNRKLMEKVLRPQKIR